MTRMTTLPIAARFPRRLLYTRAHFSSNNSISVSADSRPIMVDPTSFYVPRQVSPPSVMDFEKVEEEESENMRDGNDEEETQQQEYPLPEVQLPPGIQKLSYSKNKTKQRVNKFLKKKFESSLLPIEEDIDYNINSDKNDFEENDDDQYHRRPVYEYKVTSVPDKYDPIVKMQEMKCSSPQDVVTLINGQSSAFKPVVAPPPAPSPPGQFPKLENDNNDDDDDDDYENQLTTLKKKKKNHYDVSLSNNDDDDYMYYEDKNNNLLEALLPVSSSSSVSRATTFTTDVVSSFNGGDVVVHHHLGDFNMFKAEEMKEFIRHVCNLNEHDNSKSKKSNVQKKKVVVIEEKYRLQIAIQMMRHRQGGGGGEEFDVDNDVHAANRYIIAGAECMVLQKRKFFISRFGEVVEMRNKVFDIELIDPEDQITVIEVRFLFQSKESSVLYFNVPLENVVPLEDHNNMEDGFGGGCFLGKQQCDSITLSDLKPHAFLLYKPLTKKAYELVTEILAHRLRSLIGNNSRSTQLDELVKPSFFFEDTLLTLSTFEKEICLREKLRYYYSSSISKSRRVVPVRLLPVRSGSAQRGIKENK